MRYHLIKKRYSRILTLLSASAFLCVGGWPQASVAENYGISSFFNAFEPIEVSIGTALKSGNVLDRDLLDQGAMQAFYEQRERRPFWVDDDGPTGKARQLLERLEDSWTHGLNPETYHFDKISALLDTHSHADRAALELLLTDAFLRYARDLSGMRIDGTRIKLKTEDWVQAKSALELSGYLQGDRRFSRVLDDLEPNTKVYKALQGELIRLSQDTEQDDFEKYLPIEPGGILKPGWGHRTVEQVRARLGVPQPDSKRYHFDDALAAAVMEFQRDNNLGADGVIGVTTLKLLNRTKKDKYLQIIANMERLRWVDPNMGERYAVVNIPSSTLWGIDEGKIALEMPVIVGSPWRRTRSFRAEIRGVRLNPTWTIPPTVKRFDILPAVQEDINFLYDRGIELYRGYGRDAVSIDPQSVDWENISREELNVLRMIQKPGENNPLGRVRILMPNPYNMYLHDTNHPELFDKPQLALSSGCMRMKYPEKMADFVMDGQKEWNDELVLETFETGKKTDFRIRERIPVYIFYYTMWLDNRGRVVYGSDIYNYDTKLIEELARIDGYVLPRQYQKAHRGEVAAVGHVLDEG